MAVKKQLIVFGCASALLAVATIWAVAVIAGYFLGWLAIFETDTTQLIAGLGWVGPAIVSIIFFIRRGKLE